MITLRNLVKLCWIELHTLVPIPNESYFAFWKEFAILLYIIIGITKGRYCDICELVAPKLCLAPAINNFQLTDIYNNDNLFNLIPNI